ncbi:MAG TPA: fatty acid desaturase [Crenotrichaceae bacterium]|nr:fatty acid desaturase [Crenotrichaceae bacterium]
MKQASEIPGRLNCVLGTFVFGGGLLLLWGGSRVELVWSIPLGIVFSFLMLTNYALMHEAAHNVFHHRSIVNHLYGVVLGWLFPMSFTVFKVSHVVHHCYNRSDHEMFDYYYENDWKIIKYIQWYGLLTGLWWILIPIGNVLLAIHPAILKTRPFRNARSTSRVFDNYDCELTRRLRLEILSGILFWTGASMLLALRWETVLIYYGFFAFNWSTRQYVTHAFTVRDVTNGALNLSVSKPMQWILLQGQWDLVHHQHPHVSWIRLPDLSQHSEPPRSYLKQYLSLWAGPRLCKEPAPEILPQSDYQLMQG